MSLLVTAVLLLSLLWSEIRTPVEADNALGLFLQVVLISMLVPAFAAFQMWFGRKRHRKELPGHWGTRFRAMVVAHTIVWAVVSLVIIFAMRWPDIVGLVPHANSLPLVDDILLLAPALISLISSWAIFVYSAPNGSLSKSKSPSAVLSLWVRMRIVMVLAPVLFAFLVTDCLQLTTDIQFSQTGVILLWCSVGGLIGAAMLFYPRLMLLVWNTKPLDDADLKKRVDQHIEAANLRPRKVHVWKTGGSVANAAAIGIVPGTEVIVLSDMLLDKFNDSEIDAIVLHEIGHIKLRHCIKRIAMVLVPLFLLAADQSLTWGMHAAISESIFLHDAIGSFRNFLPAVGFLVYLLIASSWLFRKMELEADQFAIETLTHNGSASAIESALEKLAIIYPRQINRRSGLHPSIRERMAFATELRARNLDTESVDIATPISSASGISLDPIAAK